MAIDTALASDNFKSALDTVFAGRATWTVERDVRFRSLRVGFQCTRRTPVIEIDDEMLCSARDISRVFTDQCLSAYERHHRLTFRCYSDEHTPLLTCPQCRGPVDMPSKQKQLDYEFCERQAVLWMERAQRAKR